MAVDDFEGQTITNAAPCEHVIFTELDGTEGVLVDLNTRKYYQLNETAMLVWRGLEARKSIERIAQEMNALYDVSAEAATLSVQRLLRGFCLYKLVRPG